MATRSAVATGPNLRRSPLPCLRDRPAPPTGEPPGDPKVALVEVAGGLSDSVNPASARAARPARSSSREASHRSPSTRTRKRRPLLPHSAWFAFEGGGPKGDVFRLGRNFSALIGQFYTRSSMWPRIPAPLHDPAREPGRPSGAKARDAALRHRRERLLGATRAARTIQRRTAATRTAPAPTNLGRSVGERTRRARERLAAARRPWPNTA